VDDAVGFRAAGAGGLRPEPSAAVV
jgi:hypothetical protein